jgi:hypothetical protein
VSKFLKQQKSIFLTIFPSRKFEPSYYSHIRASSATVEPLGRHHLAALLYCAQISLDRPDNNFINKRLYNVFYKKTSEQQSSPYLSNSFINFTYLLKMGISGEALCRDFILRDNAP